MKSEEQLMNEGYTVRLDRIAIYSSILKAANSQIRDLGLLLPVCCGSPVPHRVLLVMQLWKAAMSVGNARIGNPQRRLRFPF